MLSAHKNLEDLCDIDQALQLFSVNDMSSQDFEKVSIQGGTVRFDELKIPSLEKGLCVVDSNSHKLQTIQDWFVKSQHELPINDFKRSSYDDQLFVRWKDLHPFSFSGDIRDLDFSTYEKYTLSSFLRDTNRNRYAHHVLSTNLDNLTDSNIALINLNVPDICRCNHLPTIHSSLFINNLHIPDYHINGLLNYYENNGSFEAVNFPKLLITSLAYDGIAKFTDMDIAHPRDIIDKFDRLSNAVSTKMEFFDPILINMCKHIVDSNNLFFSSNIESFVNMDSNYLKARMSLGSFNSMDSNDIYLNGTSMNIINTGAFTIPNLALMRYGGNRNNTDSTALFQVATFASNHVSNLPYDFFNIATPIDSNIPLLDASIDSNMGIVYVYENHEIKTDPTHIYQTLSNNFAPSYRLFLKDAQNALARVQEITNTVNMQNHTRENNIRMVNFETFSNTYSVQLSGLTENIAANNDLLNQGLFSQMTSNYLTSNMLRPDMNLGEIQLLFSNQLSNNLIDFENRFAKIVKNDPENLISQSDYDRIRSVLIFLSEEQRSSISDPRDYYNNPDKRNRYLEAIYQNLELNPIAWSNNFSNLYHKPSDVSQFTNDNGYISMYDPFCEYKNDYAKQIQVHHNIGIGTIVIQNNTDVDIVCDTFDACYVHALSTFHLSLSVEFNHTIPILLMCDSSDNGSWTHAPMFNFMEGHLPGLVKFTDNPMSIDNNTILDLDQMLDKQRDLEYEFEKVFQKLKSEYSRKGHDIYDFINPSNMFLFNF